MRDNPANPAKASPQSPAVEGLPAKTTATGIAAAPDATPAWRNPYVWLVVSLPAISVVAGLVLLGFALAQNDVQTPADRVPVSRRAIEPLQPAMKARNNAAEGATKP